MKEYVEVLEGEAVSEEEIERAIRERKGKEGIKAEDGVKGVETLKDEKVTVVKYTI